MLRLHDTRLGKKVPFEPLAPGHVGMYVCGVTVYDDCHVGHARTLVAFDVVARFLRAAGLEVRFVRNITDVDDKIIRRALAEGVDPAEVARRFADSMAADLGALGVAPPDVEPRATAHVAEMIEVIRRLVERGLAYPADGDVYYAVAGFPSYGGLSGQSPDELKAGARVEVGEHKRGPLDFALWKGAKPGEPASVTWPSPWGPGRPGWHIECSAMAHRYLGETFDIHGGGADLVFPHHENEIAQSQGAFGPGTFARYWLHSGMVDFGGEKMSKSLGNVVTIRRVGETHDLEALRLLLVSVHYRSPVAFELARDAEGRQIYPDLDAAEERLDYFYRTMERIEAERARAGGAGGGAAGPLWSKFREAMEDDFNTALGLAHMYETLVAANKLLDEPRALPRLERATALAGMEADLRRCGQVVGILGRAPSDFLRARRSRMCARRGIAPAGVEARIRERAEARAQRAYERADAIRSELAARGIELQDSAAGTTWRVV